MARPTRVYVVFPDGGRQYRYLVGVGQVRDFKPVSLQDFDEDAVYMVKWQKSDLHGDGFYPASIIMLGYSDEEILMECRERNLKIPQVLQSLPESGPSSSSSRRSKSSVASPRKNKSASKAPAAARAPAHGHKSARLNSSVAPPRKILDAKRDRMEKAMQMRSKVKRSSPLKVSLAPLKSPHRSPLKTSHRSPLKTPHRSPLKTPHRSPLKTSHRSPLKTPHRSPLKTSQSLKNKKVAEEEMKSWVVKRKDASSSQSEDLTPHINAIIKQEPPETPPKKIASLSKSIKKGVLIISSDDDDNYDDPMSKQNDSVLSSGDEEYDDICDEKFTRVDPTDITTEEEEDESGNEEEKLNDEERNSDEEVENPVTTEGDRVEDDSKRVVKRLFNDMTATGTNSSKRLKPMPENEAEVHLGYGMGVGKDLWEKKIRGAKKQSSAVNYLTGFLWSEEERKGRSLTGKSKGRNVKKATPMKVRLVEDFVKARLLAKKITDKEASTMAVNEAHSTIDSKFYESFRAKRPSYKIRKQQHAAANGDN